MPGAALSSSFAATLRPSLVTLMLTTAGPYFSTSPLKSGSAATGATLAGAEIAGVDTVGGEVAASAVCIDILSAVVTPIANAAAIASATALRRKFLDSMCAPWVDDLAGMFRHASQDTGRNLREH